MGFGGRTGFHKKIIDVQVGGSGGAEYKPPERPYLKKISGAKILVKCRKKLGLQPKNKGGPKIEKKVVFWHKKCEKFPIRHPIFFSQKKSTRQCGRNGTLH